MSDNEMLKLADLKVEQVEMVSYERSLAGEPTEPIWRIVIDGYCADFPTETAAKNFLNALTRAAAASAEPEIDLSQAELVLGEAYQVVGTLLSDTGQFDTDRGQKILDNLSQGKMVHSDILPWPSVEGHNTAPDAEIVAALALAYHELKKHDADYHHRTSIEINNKIVDALAKAKGVRGHE